jgi:pyridoxamine 5'-phosphate oxidase
MVHTDVDLGDMRRSYRWTPLRRADLDTDPFRQFAAWLDAAITAGVQEPNAMSLATVDGEGRPSVRTVLLKGVHAGAFVFFTNYDSDKARDLAARPECALLFGWITVGRQVTVSGTAQRVPEEDSDAYFATRPRGSQIGAWASPQSSVIAGRAELDERRRVIEERFPGDIPRPPHWGGFRVVPRQIEFWQGRADRLHDRFRYRRAGDDWTVDRLGP